MYCYLTLTLYRIAADNRFTGLETLTTSLCLLDGLTQALGSPCLANSGLVMRPTILS
jgi:hypothetical protein